jgi:hypothetical protein
VSGGHTGIFVVCSAEDSEVVFESVSSHRGAIGTSAFGGSGVFAAVDVDDGAVAEFDEVVHRLPDAFGVRSVHAVHVGAG